jgi:hypothetical protein
MQLPSTCKVTQLANKLPNLVTLSVGCQLLLYPTAGVYSADLFAAKRTLFDF